MKSELTMSIFPKKGKDTVTNVWKNVMRFQTNLATNNRDFTITY